MFETLPHFEYKTPIPPETFGATPGSKRWRLIRRVFNTPSFILSICLDGADVCHTYLVGDFRDVTRILSREDVTRHEIFILIPDYLNGHGDPALYRLMRVFRGTFEGDNVEAYVCSNGQTYFDSDHISDDAFVTNKVIVYEK